MATLDPQIAAHLEWIGFVRPTGLVVSAPALVRAGAILDRNDAEGQRFLRENVEQREFDPAEGSTAWAPSFHAFASTVLGWNFSPTGYAGSEESPIPADLEVPLPDYGTTLRPDFVVRELDAAAGDVPWQLLVRVLEAGQDFDTTIRGDGNLEASARGRMERLLRRTGVPAGLLFNGRALRLVSAPRGESSGWIDFCVDDMVQTAGRPICTALRLLLGQTRLLSLPRAQRLTALLEDSRKFQNEVSERLAEQVLHGLYDLLRGFQAAHDASGGELLREPLRENPDEVYRALLTVTLRLVFLLYAEERDMLPGDEAFQKYYSLAGLHARLREDAALFPDTMEQRYGAWPQLLVLFRMVFDGAESGEMRLPQRHGVLFDPDRFPFLEGRPAADSRQIDGRIEPPLVPDGTIYRVLENLLVLDGERISYRALDVEQIGSVYETMMGFRLEQATGRSVAIKASKRHGAPTTINLETLLAESPAAREKWVKDQADRALTDKVNKAVKDAVTLDDLHAALDSVVDRRATPDLIPVGAMALQPSEERRRSGSHYTPRTLTEPIIRTTLEPILKRLRGEEDRPPMPAQILELKVCDPAMGSGAFLVEACRHLGDALIEAWRFHDQLPSIPPDEDEVVLARRLIAQRCLYGVDKNPVAVDLAKMSLWLVTLARDHPLTFLDHALRHGDSLVGLSRKQIEAFHWDGDAPRFQAGLEIMQVREHVARVTNLRRRIREADESVQDWQLRDLWNEAQMELGNIRLFGDLVLAAFFEEEKPKERERKRNEYATSVLAGETEGNRERLDGWRDATLPLVPFHWEIEFPEVFERRAPGFDVFVGNPPFAGKNNLASANLAGYADWLRQSHEGSHGNADLVAHFFRRAFDLLREGGAFGLIATNTIGQGDTRSTGLRWICEHGGDLFAARKRLIWPGLAAVVVSVIHGTKGRFFEQRWLDDRPVEIITAFLADRGPHSDPSSLSANASLAFVGNYVLGDGFIFDDSKPTRWPVSAGSELLVNPHNREVLRPYLTGDALNSLPDSIPCEIVIDFGNRDEEAAREWPELIALAEERVKPGREKYKGAMREKWWLHARSKASFYTSVRPLERVIVTSQTSPRWSFTLVDSAWTYDQTVTVILSDSHAMFAILSSRLHEAWARFVGSSMKDDLRYTPSDCFETFPFPEDWGDSCGAGGGGQGLLRVPRRIRWFANNEGLTRTYNRFHRSQTSSDPENPEDCASSTRPSTVSCSTPTAGTTSQPIASSSSTTRSTRRSGAARRSLTATAGPMTSMMKCWLGCLS